jgi:hypothetical protein
MAHFVCLGFLQTNTMAKNKEKLVGRNCAHQGIFANPV